MKEINEKTQTSKKIFAFIFLSLDVNEPQGLGIMKFHDTLQGTHPNEKKLTIASGRSRGCKGRVIPPQSNYFSFSYKKLCQIIGKHSPMGLMPPMKILAGLSLAVVHSSTNMLKSVWASDFWKPLVHTNISKILKIFLPFPTFQLLFSHCCLHLIKLQLNI